MITRGIVEKRIDPFHVKVRIPSIDRVVSSSVHTSTENLSTATYATIPGMEVELQSGDVVILDVGSEDCTILGYLYRDASIAKKCVLNLSDLFVDQSATLPLNTTIGNVTSADIQCLAGVTENIQEQIESLKKQIAEMRGDDVLI